MIALELGMRMKWLGRQAFFRHIRTLVKVSSDTYHSVAAMNYALCDSLSQEVLLQKVKVKFQVYSQAPIVFVLMTSQLPPWCFFNAHSKPSNCKGRRH